MKKVCISSLTPEFPEDCKFFPADTKEELHKVSCFYHFVVGYYIWTFELNTFVVKDLSEYVSQSQAQ